MKSTANLNLGYALFTKPKNTIPSTEDDIYSAVTGILAMEGMSKEGISCSSPALCPVQTIYWFELSSG